MHVPVGNDEWYLCDAGDEPDHEYVEFHGSHALALQWVKQFRGDLFAQSTLRSLLGRTMLPRTDEQVARDVASRLTSGVWKARRPVLEVPDADRGLPQDAPVAFPREARPAPQRSSAPGPEAPIFPADVDALAIAEAQKHASALGVPFCEECLRAQLARAR